VTHIPKYNVTHHISANVAAHIFLKKKLRLFKIFFFLKKKKTFAINGSATTI
jgi:hypothetical protein